MAPVLPAEPVLAGLPVAATAGPPTAELPRPIGLAEAADVEPAPMPTREMAVLREADEGQARRAFETAAEAARSIAAEFAEARALAERDWARAREPQPLLAATPADEVPDDAAPVKMGEFAPQLIESGASEPMAAEKLAAGPRWFGRRRNKV